MMRCDAVIDYTARLAQLLLQCSAVGAAGQHACVGRSKAVNMVVILYYDDGFQVRWMVKMLRECIYAYLCLCCDYK